jgi:hypothetical protein
MVTRTAFTELRESWVRLAAALLLLAVMFPVPPVLVASIPWTVTAALLGAASWILMTLTYLPAVRFFSLSPLWALTLPLAGVLYAAMTLSSGLGASQTTARGGSVTSAE